jgi:hypothetical protein
MVAYYAAAANRPLMTIVQEVINKLYNSALPLMHLPTHYWPPNYSSWAINDYNIGSSRLAVQLGFTSNSLTLPWLLPITIKGRL